MVVPNTLLVITAASLLLAVTTKAQSQPTAEGFNAAWLEYQEAHEANDIESTVATSGKVLEIGSQLFTEDDDRLHTLLTNHAVALSESGDRKGAGQHFSKAAELIGRKYGEFLSRQDGILGTTIQESDTTPARRRRSAR